MTKVIKNLIKRKRKKAEPIGDVWNFNNSDQDFASDDLSRIVEKAIKGNTGYRKYLRKLWDNESWESIKKRAMTEGSTWIVWWQDGVNAHMRNMSEK